jgi:hypothetical protein
MAMEIEKSLNPKNPFAVELTSERRQDLQLNRKELLRDQGQALAPEGYAYVGTMCTHVYAITNALNISVGGAFAHVFVGAKEGDGLADSVSEKLTVAALADLASNVRREYGHGKEKTRNDKDLR